MAALNRLNPVRLHDGADPHAPTPLTEPFDPRDPITGGTDLLSPAQREKYLARGRMHFETPLRTDPDDPGAVNGKGNVLFYEGKLDEAIMHHECAIKLAGGSYPAAERDLNLVMRVKSGAVPFPE